MSFWPFQAADMGYSFIREDSQWPQLQPEYCSPTYNHSECQETQSSYNGHPPTLMANTSDFVDPGQLEWRMATPPPNFQQHTTHDSTPQSLPIDKLPYNMEFQGGVPTSNQYTYVDPCPSFDMETTASPEPESTTEDPGQDEPYNKLLGKCLSSNPHYEMELQDIYKWFQEYTQKRHYPQHDKWKNSIRHNLSLNAAFEKGSRSNPKGSKKHMWYLTDDALQNGIKSTTAYRKTAKKVQKKAANRKPALTRQIAGAKGGRAASRSAARKRSVTFPKSRPGRPSSTTAITSSLSTQCEAMSLDVPILESDSGSTAHSCSPAMDPKSMMSSPLPNYYNGLEATPPIDPKLMSSNLTSVPENYFAEVFESEIGRDDYNTGIEYCSAPTGFEGYQFFQPNL